MRTSLSEIEEIENNLLKLQSVQDQLLFSAQVVLNPTLAEKVNAQEITYQLVHQYGRKKLKAEIKKVEHQLLETNEYSWFRERIFQIFKRPTK